jgi:hypothetical protein
MSKLTLSIINLLRQNDTRDPEDLIKEVQIAIVDEWAIEVGNTVATYRPQFARSNLTRATGPAGISRKHPRAEDVLPIGS